MPQHNQHSLVHVLLFWTTILSVIQIVFIALFFTNGYHGMSQNTSAVEPEHKKQTQANNTSSHGLFLGKMASYMVEGKAEEYKNITWLSMNENKDLISLKGHALEIMKDGYYFLNLQVTLSSYTLDTRFRVSLLWNKNVILEGWINTNSSSTGLLGKVEELSAGGTLWVSIDPKTSHINTTASVTHLDIIYMQKSKN